MAREERTYNDREPKVYVVLERKVNLGNYESAQVTVGLSQIPFDADEDLIAQMLETSEMPFRLLRSDMRGKISALRREHLAEQLEDSDPAVEPAILSSVFGSPEEPPDPPASFQELFGTASPSTGERPAGSDARPSTSAPIPRPEEIPTPGTADWSAYGHAYSGIPVQEPWWGEAITDVNADGNGGGQLKRLNTVLGAKGFADDLRHKALYCLFGEFGIDDRGKVGSVRELSKAEAALCIEWLETAPAAALERLRDDVEDPFLFDR